MSLDEQRVLMGINDWDRRGSLDEKRAHKSNTAKWIGDAMSSLRRAKKSAGHRRLKKSNRELDAALNAAVEACKRAQEACYQHGETYEMEEQADPALTKPLGRMRKRFKQLKIEIKDMESLLRKNSDGIWDPLEGAVLDAQDALTGMLNIVKGVNQYRDGRNR